MSANNAEGPPKASSEGKEKNKEWTDGECAEIVKAR